MKTKINNFIFSLRKELFHFTKTELLPNISDDKLIQIVEDCIFWCNDCYSEKYNVVFHVDLYKEYIFENLNFNNNLTKMFEYLNFLDDNLYYTFELIETLKIDLNNMNFKKLFDIVHKIIIDYKINYIEEIITLKIKENENLFI